MPAGQSAQRVVLRTAARKPRTDHLVPFLVADRRASLRIIRKIPFVHYSGPVGLMSHANTTETFQETFRRYPCGPALCDASSPGTQICKACGALSHRVVKMVDSGVFTKEGCAKDYESLFKIYERMGADYGIVIDVLKDRRATIRSARRAMSTYRKLRPRFKLVGVAQGRSVKEYLSCYRSLRNLGFKHIAVGGMLAKRANTSHYDYVRSRNKLFETLALIREAYPHDWLFALGCYHPKRHLQMERLGVWGSDYKGWIFSYEKRGIITLHHARASRFAQVRNFLSRTVYDGPLYLNGASKEVESALNTDRVLGVVSCSSRKAWSDPNVIGPVAAREAYTGPLFLAGRRYAEKFATDWVVLSGKYGFIKPGFEIPGDYNQRLSWRRNSSRPLALRIQILDQGLHRYSKVVVIGGQDYVRLVADAYAGTGIPVVPLQPHPTRIGQMIHILNDAVKSGVPIRGTT